MPDTLFLTIFPQIGIPIVKRLINQLMTNPWTINSKIQATFSYQLLFSISTTIISTNPIQKLAMRNQNDAINATLTIPIDNKGSFCCISQKERYKNFISLYCEGYLACLIPLTLFPSQSKVYSLLLLVYWLVFTPLFTVVTDALFFMAIDLSTYVLLFRLSQVSSCGPLSCFWIILEIRYLFSLIGMECVYIFLKNFNIYKIS